MPSPLTAGPLNGGSAAGVGSGLPNGLACRPPAFGAAVEVGAVVLDGLVVVVVDDVAGVEVEVEVEVEVDTRAAGLPVPHAASVNMTQANIDKRAGVLIPGRHWMVDIGPEDIGPA
ncbi:MAG: hypothetical protein ACYCV7_08435 [Acidimicrobiales bacterium]